MAAAAPLPPPPPHVPLRVQSAYSMLASTIAIEPLVRRLAAARTPAAALVDRGNLHGAMAFSAAAMKAGVQPVLGALVPFVRPSRGQAVLRPGVAPAVDGLVLLAQDEPGWRRLIALVSRAHLTPAGPAPAALLEWLDDDTRGLFCLTGGADGALARLAAEGQEAEAGRLLERLRGLFCDRLAIEIARSGDPVEEASEPFLLALAARHGLAAVATAPAEFLEPGDSEAHDAMLCIASGSYLEQAERPRSNPRRHLLSDADYARRFADLPEARANALAVARRTAFAPCRRAPLLPRLVADPAAERAELERQASAGLARRLKAAPATERKPYDERLAFELEVIGAKGFAGYFLIVADFIGWARGQAIPVGPGRGSGAGSLVAWALGITDLDPLPHALLFERFLNPERLSMPDFDIDFCETRREEVIRYVQQRYGADRVAQIVTFGTLKARAVVKDVGRVMQLPYGEVDRLSKLIPAHPSDPWDLARALAHVPELAAAVEADPRTGRLMAMARRLEGLPRHASTHAAGLVIGDRPLVELVPLIRDPRSEFPVTQYDLKWAEEAGLVKFDFLGLKTLSVLARCRALLARRGVEVDFDRLPLDDPDTYALLARGDTVGVFQFESEGMRRALALVKPDRFEDIVALGALYRPGPMDNIPSFAARKWGRERVDMLHPALQPILAPTYGIIVYQEQVMQIAQVLAGYSLGEADLLRRAMGKKIKTEMDAQEARFVDGAVARGMVRGHAASIFRLVEKFAGYGFNKSHAAAYALVSWQTAWAKAHHPAAFYAASMAFAMHDTDTLALFARDMARRKVPLLPPSVAQGSADFAVEATPDGPAVRHALGALKGVGEGAMAAIVAEREAGGAFRSLDDWVERVDPQALNRRQIEVLAAAGALDALEPDRARLHAGAERLLAAAQAAHRARSEGQAALFGAAGGGSAIHLPPAEPWSGAERLAREAEAFGFPFSGHPLDCWAPWLEALGVEPAAAALARPLAPGTRSSARLACLVTGVRRRRIDDDRGERHFLLLDLADASATAGATAFEAATHPMIEEAAAKAEPLLLDVELWRRDEDPQPRIGVRSAARLAEAAMARPMRLVVRLDRAAGADEAVAMVAALAPGGRAEVELHVPVGEASACVRLAGGWRLDPATLDLLAGLSGVAGVEAAPRAAAVSLVAGAAA